MAVRGTASREEITDEVAAERTEVAEALREALEGLIVADVRIDNPEVFYLHRVKDGQDVYFLINPTFSAQTAEVTLAGDVQPLLWNPSTGTERPIVPSRFDRATTRFKLDLPPVGSTFVLAAVPVAGHKVERIVDTNVIVDRIGDDEISGYARTSDAHIVLLQDGTERTIKATAAKPSDTLVLDGDWEFAAEDANALVIGEWLTTPAQEGVALEAYNAADADTDGWQQIVPGAWSYQLPTEPAQPYPIDVWYRVRFAAEYVPDSLSLIVDGFAGASWQLYVNGQAVTATPTRSAFDSQMQAVELGNLVREGTNVVALCLTVANATDGLLDLVKITGNFSLRQTNNGEYSITAPRTELQPAPWTSQGYPFFSGRGVYRRRIELPPEFDGQRIFVEPELADDVLEVVVNGQRAGSGCGRPMRSRLPISWSQAKMSLSCGLPIRW